MKVLLEIISTLFFISTANKTVNKIPKTNKTFDLSNLNTNSLFLSPIAKQGIERIISCFKLNKATDPNSIPVKILKDF